MSARRALILGKKTLIAETCLERIAQARTRKEQLVAIQLAMNSFLDEALLVIAQEQRWRG